MTRESAMKTVPGGQWGAPIRHREGQDAAIGLASQAGVPGIDGVDPCPAQVPSQRTRQVLVDEETCHLSDRADLLGLDDFGSVPQCREDILAFDSVFLFPKALTLEQIRRELAGSAPAETAERAPRLAVARSPWTRVEILPGLEVHVSGRYQLPAPGRLLELVDWCRRSFRQVGEDEDSGSGSGGDAA